MSAPEVVGRWKIGRRTPKTRREKEGHKVAEALYLRIYKRQEGKEKTLANLTPVSLVKMKGKRQPGVLPIDRAIAWEELIGWIKHLAIFPDSAVQEGQFENRMEWENWAHGTSERPDPDALYDWHKDEETLLRLRPRYEHLATRLAELIGHPQKSDFDLLYPNKYDDEGHSDQARQAIRDLKCLFGAEILR